MIAIASGSSRSLVWTRCCLQTNRSDARYAANADLRWRASNWRQRPTAVLRVDKLGVSNGGQSGRRLRTVSAGQSHKNRVPGSGRSCGPALDPQLTFGTTKSMPGSGHSAAQCSWSVHHLKSCACQSAGLTGYLV